MAYDPPIGSAVNFEFSEIYISDAGGNIIFGKLAAVILPDHPDFNIPWNQLPAVDNGPTSGWKDRRQLTTSIGMGWLKRLVVEAKAATSWRDKAATDESMRSSWGDCQSKIGRSTYSRWRDKAAADQFRSMQWSLFNTIDANHASKSVSPPALEVFVTIGHDSMPVLDLTAVFPWGNPPPKDLLHRTVWGKKYYQEICWRRYDPQPGNSLDFNIHLPITLVDDGENIRFRFDQYTYDRRCNWREPSGWRDAYFYINPGVIPATETRKCWVLMNTILLKRVADNKPLDVRSITVNIDWDSWVWSFQATINSEDSFKAVDPDENPDQIIEANINGYIFRFTVEGAEVDRTFAQHEWSISGRGQGAELAEPYAEQESYTETADRTAQQLIEEILLNTGWTVDFQGVDWLVSGGAFSYLNATPLQAIQQITEAAGAIIQAHQLDKQLIIKPRYPVSPWAWNATAPEFIIGESVMRQAGRSWRRGPDYNGLFVSGTNQGVLAKVMRTGTSGTSLAPMVTSDLITAVEVARERGRNELAGFGNWQDGSFILPLMPEPDLPGLILPGTLLQAKENNKDYRCMTVGNTITATRQGGLKVWQEIEVRRYRGN